ncbi:MAG: hypothetical protein A2Y10_19200 [Planctomycetes bacterium GWF2_41_51]|nr:MAG: hypothetical protein A2Y10_19200 [Planctomycetes bacterium GWF2_41_51]HBG27728.1 hypothetical protein [Phycisphaerales bacterium]
MAMEKVFEKNHWGNFLSFLFILIFFSVCSNAAEIYVFPQTQEQIQSGHLQVSTQGVTVMYPNIQAAIDAAVDGDIIYLAPARWKGEGNRDLDFKGKAITVSGFDPNNPDIVATTIIDCNGTQTEPHRGFYFHSGEDANSVLSGITITNGYGPETDIYGSGYLYSVGGAVLCKQSSPTISSCIFTNNSAVYGGAVLCVDSNTIFNHCTFKFNSTITNKDYGSGIRYQNSSLSQTYSSIIDCTFTDNNNGSAIFIYGSRDKSNYLIKNCVIERTTSNFSYFGVGGIYCGGGNIAVENCRIESNQYFGVRGEYGTANISNCQIKDNCTIGLQGSAGIYNTGRCRMRVKNSTVIGNKGKGIIGCEEVKNCFIGYNSENGIEICQKILNSKTIGNGGIGITNPMQVLNCIIAKNKKQGIRYVYNNAILANCTVVENDSVGVDISSGSSKIVNCIVRDNFGEQIKGATSSTKITYTNSYTSSYSDLYVPFSGVGNINEEPKFVSEKDYHLLPDSLCIDAGTNDANFISEPNDIEGSARIIDGDSNGIETADMGAYEYNPNEPVIAVWADRIVCLKNAGNQTQGNLYIKNAGADILGYEIISDENWLMIDNPAGTSAGEVQDINVSINADNLELGDYYCRVKIYSDDAVNNPQELWLQVHIGTLWNVPMDVNTIQAAIDAASNFDYVCVMDGNYTGPGNRDITFGGKNLVLYSESGNPENCIIDCERLSKAFNFINGETEAVLNAISIINTNGEAVVCDACSSPFITNCIFSSGPHGVYVKNFSSVKITKCKFLNLFNDVIFSSMGYRKIDIRDCIFPEERYRSAISISNGDNFSLKNCDIKNTSNEGISCWFTKEIIIENISVRNCKGGGICLYEIGEVKISNTEVLNNKCQSGTPRAGIGLYGVVKGRISNCIISSNGLNSNRAGIFVSVASILPTSGKPNLLVQNSLIIANDYGCYVSGYSYDQIQFENCTFTNNRKYLMSYNQTPNVSFKNCILWDENLIYQEADPVILDVSYSTVRGGWEGIGNIDVDPKFVEPGYWDANNTASDANDDFWVEGDYHLMSEGWRWDALTNEWTYDRETSRCIDAGSPGCSLDKELLFVPDDPTNEWGENLRIDMGCYGGTAEASIPPYGWALLGDMDNSGRVNFEDYAYLTDFYGMQEEKLDGDLNRDGIVDFDDMILLAADWLKKTDWAPRK